MPLRDILLSPVWLIGLALLTLLGLSFLPHRPRFLRAALIVALGLWWGLSAPVTANLALSHLETKARLLARRCGPPQPDSLFIVLAGGVRSPAASADDITSLSAASLRRTLAAVAIASRVPASRLLLSGGHGGRHPEAQLMRSLALRLGFDRARVQIDDLSRTTFDSARNLARRLHGSGKVRPYLVTSAGHMPRAYLAFRRSGLDVCALPVDFEAGSTPEFRYWVPSMGGLAQMSRVLHEYLGLLYYRAKFLIADWHRSRVSRATSSQVRHIDAAIASLSQRRASASSSALARASGLRAGTRMPLF